MVKRSKNIPPANNRLSFFKILFPGFSTQRLQIPRDFVQHISAEAYKFATLEDFSGSHWQVKLRKTTGGTFIEDGWQHFVEDHSINDNNFLVFGYDGSACFNVSIFDESACERCYAFSVNPKPGMNANSDASSETSTDCSKKTSEDDPGQHLSIFKPNELKKARRESVLLTREPLSKTIRSSSRRPATEEEIAAVWKEAESFTSKFPYFFSCLNATNVYRGFYLLIPRDFVRKHIHNEKKSKVILWNRKGQSWEVNMLYTTRRTTLSGGWRTFVHSNKLEKGDICIFELVGKLEMQVHILRAVKKVKFAVE